MILVSPAEPPPFKDLGPSSSTTEDYGADFLIPATHSKLIAVQRKEFPDDFLGSLYDDRLALLAAKIRAADMRIMLLEGEPMWTQDGHLKLGHGGFGRKFTLAQLRGLLWSLHWEYGVASYWTRNKADTVEFLTQLALWASKGDHLSLRSRGGPELVFGRKPSIAERQSWVMQGFPGVGPTVAESLVESFHGLPFTWKATRKEMLAVPGIGKGRLDAMCDILPMEGDT